MGDDNKGRASKKQKEIFDFVEKFIAANGYGPSYREIMKGCGYTSVATVALHVDNLIKKGYLKKRNHSARSLEVANNDDTPKKFETTAVKPSEEKWLVDKIDYYFRQAESLQAPTQEDIDNLYVLIGALKVLKMEGAAQSFIGRLSKLKDRMV